MKRALISFAVLLAPACIPSFEDVDCYSMLDCAGGLMCVEGRCQRNGPTDSGPDADGGFADARVPDAEVADAGPQMDIGVPDIGPPDIGPADQGGMDAGPVDEGSADVAMPDSGMAMVRIGPDSVDFGVARTNCMPTARRIEIENLGSTPITVRSVIRGPTTSAEFQITSTATPFPLAPGQTAFVQLGYVPVNEGTDLGTVTITVDGAAPVEVSLRGQGQFSPMRTEMFRQTAGPIDILFVVDDSSDMDAFQQELANEVLFMTLLLNFEGWDFQIGVTTTGIAAPSPAGALIGNPAFLRATDPNFEAVLEARIRAGEAGDPVPRGMLTMRNALTPPLTLGTNMGFLRPEAALLVIFIGSEEDNSPGNSSDYSTFLLGLKTDPGRVKANSITSDRLQCNVSGDNAVIAVRYDNVATNIGGEVVEICQSDYSMATESLPNDDRETALQLTSDVMASSLAVTADGQVVPGGNYTYNAGTRQLEFTTGNAPAPGVSVVVQYQIQCL